MSTDGSFAEGLVGVVLDGRYRLDAVLGEGGMGSVFRAHHLAMDRKVAVKLLKPHLTQDATAAQRFLREARATLKVDSPHAVKVLDFGITPHGDYYMVLEYLDGRTVGRELEIDGPFAPARVLHIARQALHALGAAHRSGLIHRDIKPDNLLLMRVGDDPDHATLLDFGVAKLLEGTATSDRSQLALTAAGMVFGTPEYMSPEQACGQPLDARSDLYSLGATLFAMLTGCGLFEGRTAIEWLTHHVRTPPPHLADLVPALARYPALDAVLQRCLAKSRDARPASAEELDRELARLETELRGRDADLRGLAPSPRARSRTSLTGGLGASSSFIAALPAAIVVSAPPAASTGEVGVRPRGRRGLTLGLLGLVTLGVLGTALGLALRGRDDGPRPPARAARAPSPAPAIPPPPPDAGIAVVPPSVPVDAGVRPSHLPVPGRIIPSVPRDTPARQAARAHLEAAEAALRDDNRLRQLAEADLALKADPRSARARYLLADALLKTGDLERGCASLRQLGRSTMAVTRASAAHCPPPPTTGPSD